MKRFLLSLTVLLGGAIGSAQADYVKIIINLAASKEPPQQNPAGQFDPNNPMGFPMGGSPMGGSPMGGGSPAVGGAGGFGRGPMGGSPMGGGFPMGGAGGLPGSVSGAGGGFPMGGSPMGDMGDMGSADGMPGGAPGAILQQGGFGEEAYEEPESSPFFVEAVIELDSRMHDKAKGWDRGWSYRPTSGRVVLKHKWGETSFFYPADIKLDTSVGRGNTTVFTSKQMQLMHVRYPSVNERFDQKKKQAEKTNTAEDWLRLAEWALSDGLVDQVPDLVKRAAAKNPKLPAVVAFEKVIKDMRLPLKGDDGSAAWRERLGDDYKSMQSEHYTILYDLSTDVAPKSRLDRLEENYRAFFYWFALHGRALPVPQRRLIAVLVDSQEAFDHQHKDIFDAAPMTADGFYVERDNLAVFSSRRLDESYDGLVKLSSPLWQNWTKAELLKGGGWRNGVPHSQVGLAQVLALLLQSLEEEGERHTVTLEGTRQLVRATGLVPANVKLPHWIDSGMASFFETPRGAFWAGYGAPHWNYLIRYKGWEQAKKLDKPEVALQNVVTDRYFHEAIDVAQKERAKEKDRDEEKADRAERKARALAWALVYYLMNEHRDGIFRYYQELSNLPRDLTVDEDVLLGCFARAFNLVDIAKPNEVNANKLLGLANNWVKYMRLTNLEATELMNRQVRDYKKSLVEPTPPGRPGGAPGQQGPAGGQPTGNRPMGTSS